MTNQLPPIEELEALNIHCVVAYLNSDVPVKSFPTRDVTKEWSVLLAELRRLRGTPYSPGPWRLVEEEGGTFAIFDSAGQLRNRLLDIAAVKGFVVFAQKELDERAAELRRLREESKFYCELATSYQETILATEQEVERLREELESAVGLIKSEQLLQKDLRDKLKAENARLRDSNQRLGSALLNAWVDYDQTPGQMGTAEHDARPCGVLKVLGPVERYPAGKEVVLYRLDQEAVDKIAAEQTQDWYAIAIRQMDEIRELESENARLKGYAKHKPECPASERSWRNMEAGPCSCGLDITG